MGTRSGTIDPTIVTYMMKQLNVTPDEMDDLLNKQSGLLGVSGVSSNCYDVMQNDGYRARLAIDILIHYIKKIIGSFVAEMNGVDVLVFTAGIGENDVIIRDRICREMDYIGITVDEAKNKAVGRGGEGEISKDGAPVRVMSIPTNEEYMIAKDTMTFVS